MSALNELLEELEVTIRDHSEVLIAELALRDELEYEKVMAGNRCFVTECIGNILRNRVIKISDFIIINEVADDNSCNNDVTLYNSQVATIVSCCNRV